MEIKSDKDHLIELRNQIAARLVGYRANISYWIEVTHRVKKISQEMVDARNNVEINEQNIKKDTLFLRCIDLMLKKEK